MLTHGTNALLQFKLPVAELSSRRPKFDASLADVEFVVDRVAAGQVFTPSTWVAPCKNHSTNALHVARTTRTNGRVLGTVQKHCFFGNRGELDIKSFSLFSSVYNFNVSMSPMFSTPITPTILLKGSYIYGNIFNLS